MRHEQYTQYASPWYAVGLLLCHTGGRVHAQLAWLCIPWILACIHRNSDAAMLCCHAVQAKGIQAFFVQPLSSVSPTWVNQRLPSGLEVLLLHGHAIQLLHLELDIGDSGPQLEAVAVLAAIRQLQHQAAVLSLLQLLLPLPFLPLPAKAANGTDSAVRWGSGKRCVTCMASHGAHLSLVPSNWPKSIS